MMLRIGLFCLCLLTLTVRAQYNPFYVPQNLPDRDSLKAIVQATKDPIEKLIALRELGHAYYENKRDSALFFFQQSVVTARSIDSKLWEADAYNSIGFVSYVQGNFPRALQFLTQAMKLAENRYSEKGEWKPRASGFVSPNVGRLSILARSYQHQATLYTYTGASVDNAELPLGLYRKALAISTSIGDKTMVGIINMNISRHFSISGNLDSVLFYNEKGMRLMTEAGYKRYIGTLMFIRGESYRKHQQPEMAKTYYWYGIEAGENVENTRSMADNSLALANLYLSEGNTDSAIFYGSFAANRFRSTLILPGLADSYATLSSAYTNQNKIDSAFHYQGLSLATRKELDAEDKSRRFQQLAFDEQLKAQEQAENEREARNRIITSLLLAGLAILTLIGLLLYRNNIARKKANELLGEKNRELEIEAALDKVRSRSLAMHRSDELQEVTNTVFEQMRALRIEAQTITIFITIEGSKDYNCWLQNDEQNYFSAIHFPYFKGNTVSEDHQMSSGDIESKTYTKELKDEWFKIMFTQSDMRKIPEKRKQFVLDAEYFTASVAEMKYTKIGLYRYSDKSFTPSEFRILKRFAQVFEQAYIRFLDLEKAETQAREAQIEAALERTRTQSMLMQHSDEIKDISAVFHQQLLHLNIPSEFSYVWLPNEEKNNHQFWASWEEHERNEKIYKSKRVTYPLDRSEPYTAACFAAWASPEPTHIEFIPPADVPTFFEAWKELLEGARNLTASHFPDGIFYAEAYMKYGCFGINIRRELTGDEREVLRRFSIEFERAYTRFLDLQKAEAQAREAEIELALERVRARTMAMHKSEELKDVIYVVYEQFVHLNMYVEHAGFIIDYKNRDDMHIWLADPNRVPSEVLFPYFDSPHWNSFIEAKKNGKDFFSNLLDFEEKNKFYTDLFRFFNLPSEAREFYLTCPGLAISTVLLDNVGLYIENFSGTPYSDEENAVLMRIGKVFQQTYTRFLDLQKAEAQAREAQIEAALERVRARAMAMHSSGELVDVANVLREQMGTLDQPDLETSAVLIFHDDLESWDSWYAFRPTKDATGKIRNGIATFYRDSCAFTREIVANFLAPQTDYTLEASGSKREEWIGALMRAAPEIAENAVNDEIANFDTTYFHFSEFRGGSLLTVSYLPPSDEIKSLQHRAAKVFDLAYRRFLDLKNAEAQAREAQIEAALERVRSRSLAMHHTDELQDVVNVAAQQLLQMNIDIDGGLFIAINDEVGHDFPFWAAAGAADYVQKVTIPFFDQPTYTGIVNAIRQREPFYTEFYSKEEKDAFMQHMFRFPPWSQNSDERKKELLAREGGYTRSLVVNRYTSIGITNHHGKIFSDADNNVLKRFGAVLEQSYTRFLDLQKAEAQAREAQIEAALERVRAKTMAMQKSDDLPDAANLLFNQVQSLGMPAWSAGYCIWDDEEKNAVTLWMSSEGVLQPPFNAPTTEDELFIQMRAGSEQGKDLHIVEMGGEELKKHYAYMRKLPVVGKILDSIIAAGHPLPIFQIMHQAYFSKGFLLFITYEPVPAAHDIFKRFSKVFEQTYTRFLDLQKAEAQAREAQIQLALERVRAKTMAMQSSSELADASFLMANQIRELGIKAWGCAFHIYADNEEGDYEWFSNEDGYLPFYKTPRENIFQRYYEKRESGDALYIEEFQGEACKVHYDYLLTLPVVGEALAGLVKAGIPLPTSQIDHVAYFSYGYLLFITYEPVPEAYDVFRRFAREFEQTYTRFLDLQRAEAQAREAQIEAALERVRAQTMAMHSSTELANVASVMFEQMRHLGGDLFAFGIVLCNKHEGLVEQWHGMPNAGMMSPFLVPVDLDYIHRYRYDQWKAGTELFSIEIPEHYIARHFELMLALPTVKTEIERMVSAGLDLQIPKWEIDYGASFKYGYLLVSSLQPFPEDKIFPRFAKVFEQAYTRFLDLQKAEAQAREAQIEAALEKVRSRTLSMQKSDELAETAAVMFRQLISLGIEPNRLYIIIFKEDTGDMEAWLTDEDGSKVNVGFTGNYHRNQSFYEMYEGWKNGLRSLVIDMQGEELQNYFNYLSSIHVPFKGGLEQKRRVQHVAFFSKGMIGIASPEPQPTETIQLLERFAAVFNLTFTRFNDLKVAEAHAQQAEQDLIAIKEAKQKAEAALTELQATQKQLIQAEKMASLGELTAGIAHEIQNPLNFVNNFAEVNTELTTELQEAIKNGDLEDAEDISRILLENEQKILQHGKRADSIVKGMLQHTRSGTGTKEPTDINALCDEYLRLAYHGLRAKDKSFNANFKAVLDEKIGKVNIVPQEIGRVILNLINNAFYAVNEKKKKSNENYEPEVVVSTRLILDPKNSPISQSTNQLIISVHDNGTGIPQKVVDKIFQPFFTTKPTGEGTGLGLSLSYDIVKAHGGELKLETREGEGSEFIIELPISN